MGALRRVSGTVMAKAITLASGPFNGVRNTTEPFDDQVNYLTDAVNTYIPDPAQGSGAYARPGFTNPAGSLPATNGTDGGVYRHVDTGGAIRNFIFSNGKILRLDANLGNPTDVTPVGISITPTSVQRFVFCNSVGGQLVVADGFNAPWVGTNLGSTPITGTYIDIDGLGGAWNTVGRPEVYGGAVFFIARTVPAGSAVLPGLGIVWSEPNQPLVGYTQTNYTDFWNLLQTGTTPIYALAATNVALYYSRDLSWGAISGFPGSNMSVTATHDLVSVNVGCTQAATVQTFGQYIYFADTVGRPWRFAIGGEPEPLWLQLRSIYEAQAALGYTLAVYTPQWWATIEPNLNLYILGVWYVSTNANTPNQLQVFEARSGKYLGRWQIEPNGSTSQQPVPRSAFIGGVLQESASNTRRYYLMIMGSGLVNGNCLLWQLTNIGDNVWSDNGTNISAMIQTARMGYAPDTVYQADTGSLITMTNQAVTVKVTTPAQSITTELAAGATNASNDGTYRTPLGLDIRSARGMQFQVSTADTSAQWIIEQINVTAIASRAGVEDS